jgi:hypothetical protein
MKTKILGVFLAVLVVMGAGGLRLARGEALSAPTFEAVLSSIRDYERSHIGHTLTIAQVLARLPRTYMSDFALMHASRSLQQGSFEAPRALVFGRDAQTIMTFNGHPGQKGYDRLEFATVNDDGDLEFRGMQFPSGDSGVGWVEVTAANPPRCMSCHGPVPHYIWEPYANWTGAFGSCDDALMPLKELACSGDLADAKSRELESYLAFRASASNHPRYKYLDFEAYSATPVAPYRHCEDGNCDRRSDYPPYIEVRPNERLGILLMRHQARARANSLLSHPGFNAAEYLFSKVCQRNSSMSPEGVDGVRAWSFLALPDVGSANNWDGFVPFDAVLLGQLWGRLVAQAPVLQRYDRPGLLGASEFRWLARSDPGRAFWSLVDRLGAIQMGFPGDDVLAWEIGRPSSLEGQDRCKALERMAF